MNASSSRTSAAGIRRLLLVALVAAAYGAICWNPAWMARLGVGHAGIWFLDMHAVLASSDAHALGLNPYLPNPLDFLHQPHVYSDWWFALHPLGLDRGDYLWLGAALAFTFLAVGVVLLGAHDTREVIWSAAILTAPPMILGFNRGNADLFLFLVLAAAVPCLVSERAALRWVGAALLLLATGLKFYPAVAGIALLARVRPRKEIVLQALALSLGTVAIVIENQRTLGHYTADAVSAVAYQVFGVDVTAQLFGYPHGAVLIVAVILFGIAGVIFWWRAPTWPPDAVTAPPTIRFIIGAALLLGCYFVTVSYAYRLVYVVFLAPLIWRLANEPQWPAWYRRLGRAGGTFLVLELWGDGLARIPLTGVHAPMAAALQQWSIRLVAVEQVNMAALGLVLTGLVVPWIRDRSRALRAGPTAA